MINFGHKRVAHVADAMEIGGQERALFQLIKAQRAAGLNVDLIVTNTPGYYGEKVRETGACLLEVGRRIRFAPKRWWAFSRLAYAYDLVHFHAPFPVHAFAACNSRRTRFVYTHRAGRHAYPMRRLLSYRIMAFYLRNFFNGISANTYHAANVASELLGIRREAISVTYNGIDFSLLSPERPASMIRQELGISDNDIVVGTSANLRPLKRIDILICAIANLKRSQVRCCVVGDGPDRARLTRMSADLGASQRILFAGKTTCIADYLQVFDIFVLPSDEAESFGNSVVEAMGFGIPSIVMRDGGGMLEHITEGGGLIAEDVADLTTKLGWLVDDEGRRRTVGLIGKSYVTDKYTYEHSVRSYNMLYELALHGTDAVR